MDTTETKEEQGGISLPADVEDQPESSVTSPPTPSVAMSTASAPTPLSAASNNSSASSSAAVSRGNSIRGNAPTSASAARIRKGLLTRAGSEAEDRTVRNVSSSSHLPHTTDDDAEDETIISDSGPMPRRFASQKRGTLSAGNRQTSQSSLSPSQRSSDQSIRSASGSGYISGSRSGSGEASEGNNNTGGVTLERAMSISSVSSVNSTSSLEAAPFREAPKGNVRLGFGRGICHGNTRSPHSTIDGNGHEFQESQQLPDQLHEQTERNMVLALPTADAVMLSTSAPTERTKRIPKQASDTWMYRVGPGMRTTKGRGFIPSHPSAFQDPPLDVEEVNTALTPSKRTREALRQKFVKGAGRMGVQSNISTQQAPSLPLENLAVYNPQDSSDDEAQAVAPTRTPLPRSSSYFGSTPHSANSVTGVFPQPSLTPVPADFRTSSVTNAPLVVSKYPENSPLLSRTTDPLLGMSSAPTAFQPLMSLDDSLDALHPRSASSFVTSRRRSSATQRPVPIRAESSDDAFDRVASPGLNVSDPSAFGASPAEPALYTLSPSSSASNTGSMGRSARPTSITSLTSLRPTPAEVVRMEAQAGIASLPETPSEPSPVPSGYDSGISETGVGATPSSPHDERLVGGGGSTSDSSSVRRSAGQSPPLQSSSSQRVCPSSKRPAILRARTSENSMSRLRFDGSEEDSRTSPMSQSRIDAESSNVSENNLQQGAKSGSISAADPSSRRGSVVSARHEDEPRHPFTGVGSRKDEDQSSTIPSARVPEASANGHPLSTAVARSAIPRSTSPASQLARSPETIRAGSITRLAESIYGMSPVSASSLRSPRIGPIGATAPSERSKSPATARSPVDFHFGETLGEGSYSTVLEAFDLLSGPSPKQSGVVDPDAVSASAAMVGADPSRRRRRKIDLNGRKSYAIKVLDKVHILKQGKQKYVTVEREALSRMIRHPGVVTLYWTFQDRESLYFVLELAKNGELLESIRQYGSFDEACARYYAAQLAETIDAMHKAGVVHRDIKPENILLDSKHRIKVTDFGSAKILHSPNANADPSSQQQNTGREERSSTIQARRAASFVGTAEYVSPELLIEKAESAGKPADWWAFGCVLFQMLAGRPPFKGANEYQTLQKVKHRDFAFPKDFPDDARDLIDRLLALDPSERLTAPDIKAHAFFDGIRFDKLWDIEAVAMKTGLAQPAPRVAQPQTDSAEMSDFSFDEGFVSSGDSQAYAGDTQSINNGDARSGPDEMPSRSARQSNLEHTSVGKSTAHNGQAHAPDSTSRIDASRSSSKDIETRQQFSALSLDSPGTRQAQPNGEVGHDPATIQQSNAAADSGASSLLRKQGSPVINGSMTSVQSWAALLLPQEVMLYSMPVLQKTGAGKMFTKRRQLILTDFPRLLCVKETASALKVKSEVILAIHSGAKPGREAGFEKVSSGRYGGLELADEGDAAIAQTPETRSAASPNLLMGVEQRGGKGFVVRTSAQSYVYEVLTGDASGIVRHIRDAIRTN